MLSTPSDTWRAATGWSGVARPAPPSRRQSQDAPTPIAPAADEVVEIKVPAPAPEPAVEVKKEEPQPAPAKKACCVVC